MFFQRTEIILVVFFLEKKKTHREKLACREWELMFKRNDRNFSKFIVDINSQVEKAH